MNGWMHRKENKMEWGSKNNALSWRLKALSHVKGWDRQFLAVDITDHTMFDLDLGRCFINNNNNLSQFVST